MIVSDPGGKQHTRNLRLINEQMPYLDDGVLLLEANPFLQPWIDFAKITKKRIDYFSRGMLLFAKVWLGPIQSGEDYEKMFTDYYSETASIKKEIAGLEEAMKKYRSEELSLLMWCNPGAVVGATLAEEGARFWLDMLGGDADSWSKKMGQELGFHHLPLVGRAFKDPPAGCMFIGSEYEKGPEAAADEFFRCMMIEKESTRKNDNGFITLFNNIQRLFLLDFIPEGKAMEVNSRKDSRTVLYMPKPSILREGEGDLEELAPPADVDPEIMNKALLKVLEEAGVFTEIEDRGEQLFQAKKALMDQVLQPILSRVETGSLLSAASTFEEFSEAIKSKSAEFPDLGKLDLAGYENSLQQGIEDAKKDPKKWAEMMQLAQEQMAQVQGQPGQVSEGEEPGSEPIDPKLEEQLLQYAKTMIFQETKTEFQEELVNSTEDSYEEARKLITEGSSPDVLAKLGETDVGKQHLDLIQSSMEKLEAAFTKLKQMK